MAIVRILLDPNAVAYTDDEIVGKINSATVKVTRADSVEIAAVLESETEKLMSNTEKDKLAGVQEGADVSPADLAALDAAAEKTKLTGVEADAKDDQTGAEVRDLVIALDDLERKIVLTNPATGEFKVIAVQVAADGKIAIDKDSEPEPEP